jgi:hypothetical protein
MLQAVMIDPAAVEAPKWIGISLEGWLTIAAVVLGPILALFAQRALDDYRETHERQLKLFRELMITRSARLSGRHVEALNAIPLEFEDNWRERKVFHGWKAYLDHLSTDSQKDPAAWNKEAVRLFIELMHEMSLRLGYPIDKERIENEVYRPTLFNSIEMEQTAIRQQLLEVLDGKGTRKIPIAVFETKFPDIVVPRDKETKAPR